jgi:hypothetical protein
MEIAGRVATIDVQTIAVRDLTTEAQGQKAVLDRQVKTEVQDLTTEAQGQKAVQDLWEKTEVPVLTTEALDQ